MSKIISFTFDDGLLDSAKKIDKILYPYKATFYLTTGWVAPNNVPINDSANEGKNHGSIEEWMELNNRGHDIGGHTVSHIDYTKVSAEEYNKECTECLDFIKQFHEGPFSFAYPFCEGGEIETPFDSCRIGRTADKRYNDLNNLDLKRLISCDPCEKGGDFFSLIYGMPENSWLIFRGHGLDGEGWNSIKSEELEKVKKMILSSDGYEIRTVKSMTLEHHYCIHDTYREEQESQSIHLDWSDKISPDLEEILQNFTHYDFTDKVVLQVGVGNNALVKEIPQAKRVDGITISKSEKEVADSLSIPNYNVSFKNKYTKDLLTLPRDYDFIIDNNLFSFTLCFQCGLLALDRYFRLLLKPGGRLLIQTDGLNWHCHHKASNVTVDDIVKMGYKCNKISGNVYEVLLPV